MSILRIANVPMLLLNPPPPRGGGGLFVHQNMMKRHSTALTNLAERFMLGANSTSTINVLSNDDSSVEISKSWNQLQTKFVHNYQRQKFV